MPHAVRSFQILAFGFPSRLPASVHVVLLTPKVFEDHPRTRFYGCKFQEYCPNGTVNQDAILADLKRLSLTVAHKCDMEERLASLRLHWATYEDVIRKMPDSSPAEGSPSPTAD
jgi:hypothetical protein